MTNEMDARRASRIALEFWRGGVRTLSRLDSIAASIASTYLLPVNEVCGLARSGAFPWEIIDVNDIASTKEGYDHGA